MAALAAGIANGMAQLPPHFLAFRDIGSVERPDDLIAFSSHQTIGQSFRCNFPNLSSVGFFVSIPREGLEGELIFHLKETPKTIHDLVAVKIKGAQVRPQGKPYHPFMKKTDWGRNEFFYYVEFDPIYDSAGKTYYFYLEFLRDKQSQDLESIFQIGKFNASHYTGLTEGTLYLDHRPEDGNSAFITCCSWVGSIQDAGKIFWGRLNQDRRFLTAYVALLILIIAGLARFDFLKRKLKLKERGQHG